MCAVNEAVTAVALPRATPGVRPRLQRTQAAAVLAFLLANGLAIVWLWAHGGNLDVHKTADVLTSLARLTGLLSAYLALVQVLLLARLPALERAIGFDRLSVWHRWNGHVCIDLVVAHVLLSVWGYAMLDRLGFFGELTTMIGGGIYPGMVTATIGTVALLAVVATSIVIVKRRLRYEWWYAVHLLAYAGIALAWFHQIPTGNELVLDQAAADYWRSLYLATLALLVAYRLVAPAIAFFRHGLRVAAVRRRAPASSRSRSPAATSTACARGRGSSSSGGSSRPAAGGRRTRSRSRRRRAGAGCGSRSRTWATSRPRSATSRWGRASSPRGRSARSRPPRPGARRHCSSPGGSGSRRSGPSSTNWTAT